MTFTNDRPAAAAVATIKVTQKIFFHPFRSAPWNGTCIAVYQTPRPPGRAGIFMISSPVKHKEAELLATSDVYVTRDPVKASGTRCSAKCVVCRTQSQGRKSCNRCQANAWNISTTRSFSVIPKRPKKSINSNTYQAQLCWPKCSQWFMHEHAPTRHILFEKLIFSFSGFLGVWGG